MQHLGPQPTHVRRIEGTAAFVPRTSNGMGNSNERMDGPSAIVAELIEKCPLSTKDIIASITAFKQMKLCTPISTFTGNETPELVRIDVIDHECILNITTTVKGVPKVPDKIQK